jgi:hypothetical protein
LSFRTAICHPFNLPVHADSVGDVHAWVIPGLERFSDVQNLEVPLFEGPVDHRRRGAVQLERGAVVVDRGLEEQPRDLLRARRVVSDGAGPDADPTDVLRQLRVEQALVDRLQILDRHELSEQDPLAAMENPDPETGQPACFEVPRDLRLTVEIAQKRRGQRPRVHALLTEDDPASAGVLLPHQQLRLVGRKLLDVEDPVRRPVARGRQADRLASHRLMAGREEVNEHLAVEHGETIRFLDPELPVILLAVRSDDVQLHPKRRASQVHEAVALAFAAGRESRRDCL